MTQPRPDSALAKCHPACGTWAWHGKRGRTEEDGERSGSAHPPVHPPAASRLLLLQGSAEGSLEGRWMLLGMVAVLFVWQPQKPGGFVPQSGSGSWIQSRVSLQWLIWFKVAFSSAGLM